MPSRTASAASAQLHRRTNLHLRHPTPNPHHPCSKEYQSRTTISITSTSHRIISTSTSTLLPNPSFAPLRHSHYPPHSNKFVRLPPSAMSDRVIVGSNTLPSNPTPLSAPQEQQVRDLYYKNVRAKCAPEIEGSHGSPSPPPQFIHFHPCPFPLPASSTSTHSFSPSFLSSLPFQTSWDLAKARQHSHNAPSAAP